MTDAEKVVNALRGRQATADALVAGGASAMYDALADFVEAAARPMWRCSSCGTEFDRPCDMHEAHTPACDGYKCSPECPLACGPVVLVGNAALARLAEVLR